MQHYNTRIQTFGTEEKGPCLSQKQYSGLLATAEGPRRSDKLNSFSYTYGSQQKLSCFRLFLVTTKFLGVGAHIKWSCLLLNRLLPNLLNPNGD